MRATGFTSQLLKGEADFRSTFAHALRGREDIVAWLQSRRSYSHGFMVWHSRQIFSKKTKYHQNLGISSCNYVGFETFVLLL